MLPDITFFTFKYGLKYKLGCSFERNFFIVLIPECSINCLIVLCVCIQCHEKQKKVLFVGRTEHPFHSIAACKSTSWLVLNNCVWKWVWRIHSVLYIQTSVKISASFIQTHPSCQGITLKNVDSVHNQPRYFLNNDILWYFGDDYV